MDDEVATTLDDPCRLAAAMAAAAAAAADDEVVVALIDPFPLLAPSLPSMFDVGLMSGRMSEDRGGMVRRRAGDPREWCDECDG